MPLMSALEASPEIACRSAIPSTEREKMFFRIDPLKDPRWKTFIEWHPDASIFHRVEWLQALRSAYGYVPVVLTTTPPGTPLQDGLPFCEIRSALTGRRLVSVPFSDHCQPLVSDKCTFESFIVGMLAELKKRSWKYFELRPVSYAPSAETGLHISNSYHFHRLDLRPSIDLLFKHFSKHTVQRKIRKAERECLHYEEGSSEELLQHFFNLMIMTRRRHGLPPQPLKWFRCLVATFGDDLKIRVAFKDALPVASILTIGYKKTLVYKYGCSDLRYSNLGGNTLVFWHAIQDAKSNKMEELDMGRSDLDNEGLATFKENWGAERSTLSYWRFPAQKTKPGPERMIKHLKRLVSIAPDSSLVMLSNLLYRHIG